jgi:hypothetical protein
VKGDPNNLQNLYPAEVAYMSMQPPNPLGLFYAARAASVAQDMAAQDPRYAPTAKAMNDYGRRYYTRYHGGDDGWAELVAQVKSTPAPPANFTVVPAPTPKEMADKLMATKAISCPPSAGASCQQLTNDEIELILASGNQAAADKLWAGIKGVPQAFVAQVIEVTSKTELMVAFTYDSIQANRADVDLTMGGVIPASMMPKAGQQVKLQGTPVSYTVTPAQGNQPATLVIKMDKGAFLEEAAPKKPTPHHRPR